MAEQEEAGDSVTAELAAWIEQMPAGVTPRVEAARQRIGRLSRLFERMLARVAAEHDLTPGDWSALSVLHRSGPPYARTPKQLAETLGLTSGTVSVRIDRLQRAGLVEPVSAADGRSRPVRLTDRGHRRWADATASRTEQERTLFETALDADGLDRLNPLLAALLQRFEQELGAAPRHDNAPAEKASQASWTSSR